MSEPKVIDHNPEFQKHIDDNDGYCPCAIFKTEDTKCMCKDFRDLEAGMCNCGRYEKVVVENV